jgi:hypothetical protein
MRIVGIRDRPLEQAQTVWQRALDLADRGERNEPFAGVIDVLNAAKHDSTTLAHALALGRTQLRVESDTIGIDRAVRMLARAVEFLGVKPAAHAASMVGGRDDT